jgi:hypothetical protein
MAKHPPEYWSGQEWRGRSAAAAAVAVMANNPPFPFEYCPVTFEIISLYEEGRTVEAKHMVIQHLRWGYHTQPFLDCTAELLAGDKKRPGAKGAKRKRPPQWREIGNAYLKLEADGEKSDAIRADLAKKYGDVRAAWKYFKKAQKIDPDDWIRAFATDWTKPLGK